MEIRKLLLLLALLLSAVIFSSVPASASTWDHLDFSRCFHADSCTQDDQALRFRLHPGDERAEAMDPYYVPFGQTTTLRFSFRIPAGARLTNEHQAVVLAQFHARNGQSPSFAFRFKNSRDLVITVRHHVTDTEDVQGTEEIVHRGALATGEWHDFLVRVRSGVTGSLEVWREGELVARYAGPLGYLGLANYFKLGLYDYTAGLREDFAIEFRRYWREP